MDVKVFYIVSFEGIDGEQYTMRVKAKHGYEATSIVSGIVNYGQNFGFNFKAKFHNFA